MILVRTRNGCAYLQCTGKLNSQFRERARKRAAFITEGVDSEAHARVVVVGMWAYREDAGTNIDRREIMSVKVEP